MGAGGLAARLEGRESIIHEPRGLGEEAEAEQQQHERVVALRRPRARHLRHGRVVGILIEAGTHQVTQIAEVAVVQRAPACARLVGARAEARREACGQPIEASVVDEEQHDGGGGESVAQQEEVALEGGEPHRAHPRLLLGAVRVALVLPPQVEGARLRADEAHEQQQQHQRHDRVLGGRGRVLLEDEADVREQHEVREVHHDLGVVERLAVPGRRGGRGVGVGSREGRWVAAATALRTATTSARRACG